MTTEPAADLADRTVLVTGGSRGIGRAIVRGALARGARVAYCSRGDAPDEPGAGDRLLAVRADVSREEDVRGFFAAAAAGFRAAPRGRQQCRHQRAGAARAHARPPRSTGSSPPT